MDHFVSSQSSAEPSSTGPSSTGPFSNGQLTAAQEDRLVILLDQYLTALERGCPPPIEELTIDDPELVQPLSRYVSGLEDLHRISVGFSPQLDEISETSQNDAMQSLGDFRLLDEIGRGGMGIVYRAHQVSLDRTVAIKLLPFASTLDARQISRFKNEAHMAAQLHHPHIVPVFAVGSERGVHFYAMQFIDGQSLDQVIADQKSSDVSPNFRECVEIVIDASEALHAAHQFGVVHRDIKPSNLILDHDRHVWLTDFGLARCQANATLTKTGDIIGTMKYMSPEQARGESALIDGRTDVYSLGVTLYEMLCLTPAVKGMDGPALLREVEERVACPIRQLRPDLPRDLETVVAKAMSKSRDHRYETAQLFADDLRRLLVGEPTLARPQSVIDRVTQWAQKHRHLVLAVSLVGLFALIGLSVSTALIVAQMQETKTNFQRAEQNHQLWRGAVDRLGAQVAELLSDVPAAEPIRRHLLIETLAYYQEFANQAGDDPELMADLAMTQGKIGALQSEIGSGLDAIKSLETSQQLFQQLVVREPDNTKFRRHLASSNNNLGRAYHESGQLLLAGEKYREAISLQRTLAASGAIEGASELALSYNNMGLLLNETGQVEEAEEAYRKSIDLLESIGLPQLPAEASLQLAATYNNLGGLFSKSFPARAVEYSRAALRFQAAHLAETPGDPKSASRVALTLNALGIAQSGQNETEGAILSYQQAIEIQQQLLRRWPEHKSYQRDLAVTFNNLGLTLAKIDRFVDARDAFQRALETQIPLTNLFPNDANVQSTLGGVYNNLAFVQEEIDEVDQAMESYRNAIAHQEIACEAAPEVPQYRLFLSKHYYNHAKLLRGVNQPIQAVKVALLRRELWRDDGERLFNVAEELAATLNLINDQESGLSSKVLSTVDCVDSIRVTLEMAASAGFELPSDLLDRPLFECLKKTSLSSEG